MATIITGLFADEDTGQLAAAELRQRGFGGDAVRVLGRGEADPALLAGHGLSDADAARFAEGARNGGSVVSALAEFGQAGRATQVLESFKPTELRSGSGAGFGNMARGPSRHQGRGQSQDKGRADAPTERLRDDPAPFSRAAHMRVLSESDRPSADLLTDKPAPFSDALHIPALSRSQSPNVRLIADNPAPFSSLFKLPVLSRSQDAGARLISDNPAPFSALFHLPVLLADRGAKAIRDRGAAGPRAVESEARSG